MPFYYLLFYSIYKALKRPNIGEIVILINILIFAGLTLFLATPSVFSYVDLSDKYALATSEIQKNQLLSAGEAILASDMWHGTGAKIGGMLLQTGALLISVVMLQSKIFSKATAFMGIVGNVLPFGLFLPAIGIYFALGSLPFLLIWFILATLRFFQLGKEDPAINMPVKQFYTD
jgi:hypothetical protein